MFNVKCSTRSKSFFPCLYIFINVNMRDEIKIINLLYSYTVCNLILMLGPQYLYIFHLLSKYWKIYGCTVCIFGSVPNRFPSKTVSNANTLFPHVTVRRKYDTLQDKSFPLNVKLFEFRHSFVFWSFSGGAVGHGLECTNSCIFPFSTLL